jgi:hypothetical protein
LNEKGCVAHIVRLIDNQSVTKIDPPGVDFCNFLILRQTNDVCNAPFFLSLQPMEQRDYILREIEKLGMLLRAIVTRVFGGNANNAVPEEKQFDEVTEELLENAGFDLKAFIRMDDARAIKYLQDRRDFNIPNLEDLALILEKLGAADHGTADYGAADYGTADHGAADHGAADPGAAEPEVADPLATEPLPPLPLNAEPGIKEPQMVGPFDLKPVEIRNFSLKKALLILEHCRDTDRTYSFERESRIGALKTAVEEPDVVLEIIVAGEAREENQEGVRIAEVKSAGIVIGQTQDALDLMANADYLGARKIMIREEHLDHAFFDLKTGMAGEILQKFTNYRVQLAIIGDFSKYPGKSIRDFIFESNRYGRINFVSSREEAIKKLTK